MTDAKEPERIWADTNAWSYCGDVEIIGATPYVRKDLYDAIAKERDELRAEVERLTGRLKDEIKRYADAAGRADKAEAEVERLRNVITVELTEARRIADADLESQAAMERVMDYPMERTYTPAMKRFDRLNTALQRKEGNE